MYINRGTELMSDQNGCSCYCRNFYLWEGSRWLMTNLHWFESLEGKEVFLFIGKSVGSSFFLFDKIHTGLHFFHFKENNPRSCFNGYRWFSFMI